VAAVGLAAAVALAPAPEGLPPVAQRTAAVFVLALVLWGTEALPVAVTALLALVLQPVLGVRDAPAAFSAFASPVFFFVLAAFVAAAALVASGLERRFALWLLARAGTDPRRVLLALLVGTASLSTVLSDVPTCAIFMAAALGVIERAGLSPGSPFAKSVMIGIPMASMIGGIATPAGSSVNVLGLYFIEQYGQVRVSFLAWTALGVPMVLVLVPATWWALLRCFPPEIPQVGTADEARARLAALGPLTAKERRVVGLVACTLTAWILGTWLPALDVVLVALVAAVATFLPGLRLLSWQDAERAIGWEALLMIGGVTSLGAAAAESGLARWVVEALLGGIASWTALWVVAAISAFTVVAHFAIPIAPVINSVLIPPVVIVAGAAGHNPALYALPVAFTASCAFLLPLDAVALITFSRGYYRMWDMLPPGAIVSMIWIVVMTGVMMTIAPLLGFL
jgi:sodium-dependent dicarboxylate transporter 2/3/5